MKTQPSKNLLDKLAEDQAGERTTQLREALLATAEREVRGGKTAGRRSALALAAAALVLIGLSALAAWWIQSDGEQTAAARESTALASRPDALHEEQLVALWTALHSDRDINVRLAAVDAIAEASLSPVEGDAIERLSEQPPIVRAHASLTLARHGLLDVEPARDLVADLGLDDLFSDSL